MDEIRKKVEQAWNDGDLDVLDEIVDPSYVRHTLFGDLVGVQAWKDRIAQLRAAFPDFRTVFDETLRDGDRMAARFTASGTHTAEYTGVAPTSKVVTFNGMVMAHTKDGKLIEEWEVVDTASILRQLGA